MVYFKLRDACFSKLFSEVCLECCLVNRRSLSEIGARRVFNGVAFKSVYTSATVLARINVLRARMRSDKRPPEGLSVSGNTARALFAHYIGSFSFPFFRPFPSWMHLKATMRFLFIPRRRAALVSHAICRTCANVSREHGHYRPNICLLCVCVCV